MSRHRIVLVDDEEDIRLVAQFALEQLGGYEVLALGSGREAVDRTAAFSPSLLLLDGSMPGMDGPQTLLALRGQPALKHVPAVFLTAHTSARRIADFRALGAVDVIAKPFEPQHLCDRVSSLLVSPDTVPAMDLEDEEQAQRKKPVALVVEDDPGIRYLLGFILEQQGWRVLEACDGPQGLAAILDGPVTDAVLLDIMLPGVDGLQLLDIIRGDRRWKGVPVMMLTTKGDEPSVSRALAAGANDYVAKPFDPADLAARVNRLPRRHRS